ncbi:hypothetical protein E3N88_19074 [Mikania micrantha]|uniref:Uncharacterized protein n=1 Tax=Mikania micrantha TaxID=192012 RepID=A0A5N6NPV8_9ASTR|nr:hypothetical protein E3N88_19074 [Mikania micrantha]
MPVLSQDFCLFFHRTYACSFTGLLPVLSQDFCLFFHRTSASRRTGSKKTGVYHGEPNVVVRQPRLHPADAAILRDLVGSVRDLSGRVDRLEGMMRWMTERMAASAGMDIPVFPGPGHHQDPQDPGGHA